MRDRADRKALFFDVDGTLLSEKTGQVPPSAVLALKKAREKGHLVFINTGRVYSHARPILDLVESDGILCGCGTHIRMGKRDLYHRRIPHERCRQIVRDIKECGLDGVLEAAEGCCFQTGRSDFPIVSQFKESTMRLGSVLPFGWEEESFDFDKFCVAGDGRSDWKRFLARIQEDFDAIDRSGKFYECVPRGHSKASAIEWILKELKIPLEAAYVFGDSSNDLSMFQYARNSVLMGKHDAVLEPYASFVTRTVEEDGIAWAMERLGCV